jgi:hypothetical protein
MMDEVIEEVHEDDTELEIVIEEILDDEVIEEVHEDDTELEIIIEEIIEIDIKNKKHWISNVFYFMQLFLAYHLPNL